MRILGLSAFQRNAAAALVIDGALVSAAEEERISRKRGDPRFPLRAARCCMDHAGLQAADLDAVVFYQKPLRRFERTLLSQLRGFPHSARSFSREMFLWLGDRLWLKGRIAGELGVPPERVAFVAQHEALAAATFWSAGIAEAAVLVADNAGEWATTSIGRADAAGVKLTGQARFPHSLGLFVSALTQYLGFQPEEEEHKVEALAAWGEPRFREPLARLVGLEPDGGLTLDTRAFRFQYDGDLLFGPGLVDLLGPVRIPGGPLDLEGGDRRLADIAASVQVVLEDALLHLARAAHSAAPVRALCVAGSLAGNARAMARLLREGPFEELHVTAVAHDAAGAVGAALLAAHAHGETLSPPIPFPGDEVRLIADEHAGLREFESQAALVETVAEALAGGQLAGWVHGRAAWNERGLGRRSVFADPREAQAAAAVDARVARRDPFEPLRAAVTAEGAGTFFEVPVGADAALAEGLLALSVRAEARERMPAICGPDGLARVHVVSAQRDPALHALLCAFEARTGVPLLAEADLAPRGEPPVRGAFEAVQLFERSQLDLLVLDDRLLQREPLPT